MAYEQNELGLSWKRRLASRAAPLFDLAANEEAFAELLRHRETSADAVIFRLMDREVRDGILSCVERGSNGLGLEVPAEILETAAFARLRGWLDGQRLRHTISQFRVDDAGRVLAQLSIHPPANG